MTKFSDGGRIEIDGPAGFRMIPDTLLLNTRVSDVVVRLYGVLLWHGRGGHGIFPSRQALAAEIGKKSVRTIDAAFIVLQAEGYLTIHARFGESGGQDRNLYRLHFTPLPPEQRQARSGGGGAKNCTGGSAENCTAPVQKTAPLNRKKLKRNKDQGKEDLLLAVGELQDRKADSPPDLRPEIEEPALDLIDDEPPTASPEQPAPSQSPIWAILSAIPDQVLSRITPAQQPEVVNAIRAELAAETRSVAELVERVGRRWQWWQRMEEEPRCPVAVAKTLVAARLPNQPCADLRCEDGVNLDSGRPCLACADRRPLRASSSSSSSAAPTPVPVGPPSSSRPDARTVAEVLAPVPYVGEETGQTPAAQPSRSPRSPHTAVADLRAAWAAKGIHSPSRRRAAVAAAPISAAVDDPDNPAAIAHAYLRTRGDFDVWMSRARHELGDEAARDEVILRAADLARQAA